MDDAIDSHAQTLASGAIEPVVACRSPGLGTPMHPIGAISLKKITGKMV
jgi:hypothetical protein